MFLLSLGYVVVVWILIRLFPEFVIGIFSSDKTLMEDALPAFHLYFSTFIFMVFQHCGQIIFKSLGKKYHAIFFSLFRKVIMVVPLTYLLPYAFGMGTDGVFIAEPISNVIGGVLCFTTMLLTVIPELNAMEKAKTS
jgi:Na+-driven multidrug efflux pump